MLPFHLGLLDTDVTLRATALGSVQVGLAPLAAGMALAGGEVAGDAQAVGTRSVFTAEARARIDRALDLAGGPPETDVDADADASATWTTSPLSSLALTAEGLLATTYGVRADSLLLALDPFEEANRLEYAVGADLSYTLETSPRTELGVDGGVAQDGALAADVPAAVGADSREVHGGVSFGIDVAPRLSITPELRYAFTHYEHELLDVERRRGPADVHAATLALGASREICRSSS